MAIEAWIFGGVMLFSVLAWLHGFATHGVVDSVNDEYFVMRSLLGTRRRIDWKDVAQRAQKFENFLPRVVVGLRSTRFLSFTSSYGVLLRGRPAESAFLEKLERACTMKTVRNLRDLVRQPVVPAPAPSIQAYGRAWFDEPWAEEGVTPSFFGRGEMLQWSEKFVNYWAVVGLPNSQEYYFPGVVQGDYYQTSSNLPAIVKK